MTNETDVALEALDQLVPPHLRTSRHGENFMGARYELIRAALSARPAPECKDCGDSITAHDPGICGNCYAMKRPLPQATLSEERGRFGVAVSLLNECLGPLEVLAAIVESDDGDQMEALIERVRKFVKDARAVLAAARQVAVGWKLVPVEPTQAMLDSSEQQWHWHSCGNCAHSWKTGFRANESTAVYRAMLAASPSPVGQEEPGHKCGEGMRIVGVEGRKP